MGMVGMVVHIPHPQGYAAFFVEYRLLMVEFVDGTVVDSAAAELSMWAIQCLLPRPLSVVLADAWEELLEDYGR